VQFRSAIDRLHNGEARTVAAKFWNA